MRKPQDRRPTCETNKRHIGGVAVVERELHRKPSVISVVRQRGKRTIIMIFVLKIINRSPIAHWKQRQNLQDRSWPERAAQFCL